LHGAKCVLYPARVPVLADLEKIITQEQVSVLWLTSSLFNFVIDNAPQSLRGLRQLLIGGEALSVTHVKRALKELPQTRIINAYGPTEGTTFACCYPIPSELSDDLQSIPIGRPIANTRVYILDPRLNPVPIGTIGEIYIGGEGLAQGYLNDAELTTAKFIPNHFLTGPHQRLYRTGDRGRWLPTGNIEFIGRVDSQVKVRGYRIELGEIEAILAQHPSIEESVVLAREDTAHALRIVAYIVGAGGVKLPAHELRKFLLQKLPEYMVPSAFMFLESLPLAANGKLDRKALPAPDQSNPELKGTYTAPRTPTEELLAGIWAIVLKLDKVGIHDNFFELGGHSLLATQVISRIRDTFRFDLPLRQLFEAPTIYGLAQRVQELLEKPGAVHESKISRLRRENYRVQRTK
jgi:acyl-coenzyme A synthetase/AMP-(fatty) acid ligase